MGVSIGDSHAQTSATTPETATAANGTPAAEPTEKPLRKLTPGVVASSGRFTFRGQSVGTSSNAEISGNDPGANPVTGTVKRIDSFRCAAVLSNVSEKSTYSVTFELIKSDRPVGNNSANPNKRSFSATLGPGKSVERSFACQPTDNLQLALKSGRELKRTKEE
jgi:hypothetical protein